MKVLVYARSGNPFGPQLIAGCQMNRVEAYLRTWTGTVEPCDVMICKGIRNKDIIEAHSHIPVFVFEQGYLQRVNTRKEGQRGHWQLSHGWLNKIPPFSCKPDRFDRLGLKIERAGTGKYVLVIGQVPGDTALNGTDHVQWLKDTIAHYRAEGHEVHYRKHPRGGVDVEESLPGTLQDALKGARLVVTYTSNTGHEALLSGVPVVCDPSAPYFELSGEKCPSVAERRAYFHRLAYGQWKVDETKEAIAFLMNEWLPRINHGVSN